MVRENSGGERAVLFMTDQSPIHGARSPTALNLSRMNVLPGGKQPLMDDGYFYKDGVKVLKCGMFMYMMCMSRYPLWRLVCS